MESLFKRSSLGGFGRFFGYKFGYKILNSRKPSGSAGAKQLTNNLRMDAMDGADARSCASHMVRPFGWQFSTGCFLRMAPDTRGGGALGKITGGIAIQYIFARKNFGILANDNKRIKTNRAIGRISHIVVRWLRQGTVFTAPLIFREDSTPSAGSVRSTQMECAPVFGAFRRRKTLPPPQGGA